MDKDLINQCTVTAYFESEHTLNSYCEEIGTFVSEEMYQIVAPMLEVYAKDNDMILNESVTEYDENGEKM